MHHKMCVAQPADLSQRVRDFFRIQLGTRVRPKAVYTHAGFTGDFFIAFDKDFRGYDKMHMVFNEYVFAFSTVFSIAVPTLIDFSMREFET